MAPPRIDGDKVLLRPLVHEDAPRLTGILNDEAVRRNLRLERPVSLAAEQEFIAALARATDEVVVGIVARPHGRLVGVTGLHHLGDPARQSEFGIFLGGPEEWGKGYGQEATRLIVGYGFEALGLNRVWLHVHADNARGIHAYEKVGFRSEGLLRQAALRDGRFVDVVSMAVLREDWRPASR
ncbi:GNAT family N-acetyltransferase [Anaeromyxobacter oryzae]|uniref:Acetyltransferase n=1 Tax=Anaeromyxobacter oryzae TaxID=2918170 RepID=A0ABN6MP35_9BACT|nr:GNAT family protein [Anaeromyxobacter oryzae]BDG02781.1 acetyltransferase [Anaeromyxobacter oryzae]